MLPQSNGAGGEVDFACVKAVLFGPSHGAFTREFASAEHQRLDEGAGAGSSAMFGIALDHAHAFEIFLFPDEPTDLANSGAFDHDAAFVDVVDAPSLARPRFEDFSRTRIFGVARDAA